MVGTANNVKPWIDNGGTVHWAKNGYPHREGGPAVLYPDGKTEWFRNGYPHREDGPAVTWADGRKDWYWEGRLHREDGPAVKWADGRMEYWLHHIKVEPFRKKLV